MARPGVITALFVTALVIAAGAYYASAHAVERAKQDQDLTVLAARREDLVMTQQRIEQQIASINQSVQAALQQQQTLNEELEKLQKQADAIAAEPSSASDDLSASDPGFDLPSLPTLSTTINTPTIPITPPPTTSSTPSSSASSPPPPVSPAPSTTPPPATSTPPATPQPTPPPTTTPPPSSPPPVTRAS